MPSRSTTISFTVSVSAVLSIPIFTQTHYSVDLVEGNYIITVSIGEIAPSFHAESHLILSHKRIILFIPKEDKYIAIVSTLESQQPHNSGSSC